MMAGGGRRQFLQSGIAGIAGSLLGLIVGTQAEDRLDAPKSSTHPTPLRSSRVTQSYEAALQTDSDARVVFYSPHLTNALTFFTQAENWVNALQREYLYSSSEMRLVMAVYGPMNFVTYNDDLWKAVRVGEWQGIVDPSSGTPAVRNIYADRVKEFQTKHRAIFLTCNNSLLSQAQTIALTQRAPTWSYEGATAHLIDSLLPSVTIVPAVVGEVARLQARGIPQVYVPKQF